MLLDAVLRVTQNRRHSLRNESSEKKKPNSVTYFIQLLGWCLTLDYDFYNQSAPDGDDFNIAQQEYIRLLDVEEKKKWNE